MLRTLCVEIRPVKIFSFWLICVYITFDMVFNWVIDDFFDLDVVLQYSNALRHGSFSDITLKMNTSTVPVSLWLIWMKVLKYDQIFNNNNKKNELVKNIDKRWESFLTNTDNFLVFFIGFEWGRISESAIDK